jgi:hypothetical protein
MDHNQQLRLPVSVVGDIDINRLIREMEAIDEFFIRLQYDSPAHLYSYPRPVKCSMRSFREMT